MATFFYVEFWVIDDPEISLTLNISLFIFGDPTVCTVGALYIELECK